MNMTLYFAPGTCARVPLIALEETGAAFDTRVIAFMRGDHRAPDFLAHNPAGKVPVLIAGDATLTQNIAILTWLARRFPAARLLPPADDPASVTALLSRLAWFSADLHPLVTRIRMPQLICDQPAAIPRVREMACEAMKFQLAGMEALLLLQPWVLGSDWSVLDGYLYWVWFRITGAGFDAAPFPAIAAHARRMEERPAVQRALRREAAAQAELESLGLAVPMPAAARAGATPR
jgi:glutathione S-transferase